LGPEPLAYLALGLGWALALALALGWALALDWALA
jgi:hypothetical protein